MTPPRVAGLVFLVAVDAAAFTFLLTPLRSGAPMLLLLGVHACCAIDSGVLLAGATPPFARATQWEVGAFAAALSFFVPVLGLLGVVAALRLGLRELRPAEDARWQLVGEEDLEQLPGHRSPGPSIAEIRARLRVRTPETAPRRFEALLMTRHLSAKVAVPLLELAQTDAVEEIRLYAFSRLERMRRDLELQSDEITRALETAHPRDRARLHLRLAECAWELGYVGLADGLVLDHALQRAEENAEAACRLQPANAAAELLHGRILLHRRAPDRAAAAFERALRAGHSRAAVLPYLAECAFGARDLAAVGAVLQELDATAPDHAFSRPVIDLWCASAAEPS
ncbi:MAG: hypothetical protein KF819_34460 [Labilithrix sp.]|nr:hypothetical protein [Labilithrix sp.]